ncbi:hypothetical protein CIB48_g3934 [Xylaria polymorpha]|nr:hypothetical protein CIB48_g3934 [Xylaria polymorpha]
MAEMPQMQHTTSQRPVRKVFPDKFLMCSSEIVGITEQASRRTDRDRLSRLERLPNELKLMIVGQIPNARSIFNLALTGPQFCAFISVHEKKIAHDLIKSVIPAELLHVVVATYGAIESDWNIHKGHTYLNSSEKLSKSYVNSIVQFVERYRLPRGFTLQAQHPNGVALYVAFQYLILHYTMETCALKLASSAMKSIPKALGFVPEVTPTVLIRYEKALYVTQLVAELFSWRGGNQTKTMHMAWGTFWYALSPWEIEQVYGVQTLFTWHVLDGFGMQLVLDRIGRRLSQGMRDGSAAYGDVDLGPMKNWYNVLLFKRLGSETEPGTPRSFFSCMRCLILSGYAFWDEIEQSCPNTTPMDRMHKSAVQKVEEAAQEYTGAVGRYISPMWFRSLTRACTCQSVVPGAPTTQMKELVMTFAMQFDVGEMLAVFRKSVDNMRTRVDPRNVRKTGDCKKEGH